MKRLLAITLFCGLWISTPDRVEAKDKKAEAIKEALQDLQDYIGGWKGSGSPFRSRNVRDFWSVKLDWSWRFKKNDIYLSVSFRKSKFWKYGEMRYDPDDEQYQFKITDIKGGERVFTGEKDDRGYLTLKRVDPKTKEAQEIRLNTAAEGVRLVLSYSHKPKNRTRFIRDYRIGLTKDGESLGKVVKQRECIVNGRLGTMALSYQCMNF